MADSTKKIAVQPARQQALANVRQFENELRTACVPERSIRPIITCFPCNYSCQNYRFTPDEKFVAVACRTKIYLWDLVADKCIQVFDAGEWIESIDISPDGTVLASGGAQQNIQLWDLTSGNVLQTLKGHDVRVMKLAFSPDGKNIIASDYRSLRLWDLSQGKAKWVNDNGVKDFALAPDTQVIYAGSDKMIRLFELNSGKCLQEIQRKSTVHQIAVSPDGQTMVTKEGSYYHLQVIELPTGEARDIPNCSGVKSMALSPNGKTLITSHEEKVQLWDVKSGYHLGEFVDLPASFTPPVFSPDGEKVIVNGTGLNLCDLRTGLLKKIWPDKAQFSRSSALATNGQVLVTDGPEGDFHVWDLSTGKRRGKLHGHAESSSGVTPSGKLLVFTPDGRTLVSRCNDKNLRVWDLPSGMCNFIWQVEENNLRPAVAVSPDSSTIAYSDSTHILIRDLHWGWLRQTLEGHTHDIESLHFSADGRLLVSMGQDSLRQWEPQSGACLREVKFADYCQSGKNSSLNFRHLIDPDKLTFLFREFSFDENPPIGLWDAETGRCLQIFEDLKSSRIFVHPDKKTFISCTRENEITQWRLETGECIRTFPGTPTYVDWNGFTDLTFSPDGKWLVGGNNRGILYFWDAASGELLANAHNLIEGYLWATPPDDFAPHGWLHTDRPDLVSAVEVNKGDGGQPEVVYDEDERFTNYLKLFNDGEMVMTRINDWERYLVLLGLRMGNKADMEGRLLTVRSENSPRLLPLPEETADPKEPQQTGKD